jgi:Anti-sigma-K factor rskA, C-terminal
MKPDFEDLVGTDLEPEERERLQRAHDLLIAAGPPPELPPGLADPMGPPEAEVIPFWNRRRNAVLAVLAAAVAALAFGIGYLTGHTKSNQSFTEGAIVMSGTVAAPEGAHGSVQLGSKDDAGNWPMLVRVSTLQKLPEGAYYTLWITKKGRPAAPCGSFLVRGGDHPTEVKFTVAYKRANFDGWVVTVQKRGQHDPGRVVLRSSTI